VDPTYVHTIEESRTMLTSTLLAALLLGQVPDGRNQSSGQQPTMAPPYVAPPNNAQPTVAQPRTAAPASEQSPSTQFREPPTHLVAEEKPLAAVPPLVRTEAAAELLEEALTLPPQSSATGRQWTLMEVLARIPDRQRQVTVTETYWKLSSAVAEYRVSWDEFHQIDQTQPRGAGPAGQEAALLLETARASARSRLGDSELAVSTAQFELADALQLSPTEPMPLPADAPHVGSYKTYFQEIYASRPASARARWIDFALPLQLRAITARATAVRAANDANDATQEAYNQGQVELATLLTCVTELARLRRAFLTVVREYNRDIAAYALTTAPAGLDQNRLVGMLIKSGRSNPANLTPIQRTTPDGKDVQPATFNEPLPAQRSQQPTPAQPPTLRAPETEPNQFTPNPPLRPITPQTTPSGAGNSLNSIMPSSGAPANAAPSNAGGTAPPYAPEAQGNPLRGEAREAKRPPESDGAAAAFHNTPTDQPAVADTGLYGGLSALPASRRTQELAGVLHWDRGLPESQGLPITLADCLNSPLVVDRSGTITAFWLTRYQAAVYRAQRERVEHLEALLPASVASRAQPGGPEAVLRARRAKLAADADLLQAQLELDAAQYALTQLAGRSLEFKWLLPSTPPHANIYPLPQIPTTSTGSESRRLHYLATAIPAQYAVLVDRSASVVAADTSRASVLSRDHARPENVDASLAAIERQNEATVSFLLSLTRYNNDIAEYVLRTSPATTPANDIAQALTATPK
jgi:hypothetical protein